MLHLVNQSRLTFVPLEELYKESPDSGSFSLGELNQFRDTLENYKREFDKIDFTDMLESFLEGGKIPVISYLIVDETQDLSPLQWAVIELLASRCKHTYLAGDDDQTIHEYAGASADILIDLEAETIHRPQSFRVPSAIQKVAADVTSRISKRIDKELKPRDAEGEVYRACNIDDVVISEVEGSDTWLFLCRNTRFFGLYAEHLIRSGIPFIAPVGAEEDTEIRADVLYATSKYIDMVENKPITIGDLRKIYNLCTVGKHVLRGFKSAVNNLPAEHEVVLRDVVRDLGLMRADPWDKQLSLNDTEKQMIRSALKHGHSLTAPRVRISTIHSAKGSEADNVVLLPDMSQRTWQGYNKDHKPEHRVWYVGVTRARKRLFILSPYTNMFYPL